MFRMFKLNYSVCKKIQFARYLLSEVITSNLSKKFFNTVFSPINALDVYIVSEFSMGAFIGEGR